jgi:hypothetical protein
LSAREFMGTSLSGMARGLLEARGEHVRWLSDTAIVERALNSTSDFPTLLSGTGNRFLIDVFQAAASEIKTVSRQRTANDFRDLTIAKLSQAPWLEKVAEGGEIKFGSFTEGKETYRLSTFAKIFALSRQAIINDDLGAFADPLRLMGRAAAETEAQELAALLAANSGNGPTMADGNPLYHTSHGNKAASGGAISATTLAAGRTAMRSQKDLDGKTPVNAAVRFLLVSSDQEELADRYCTAIAAVDPEKVNTFAGKIKPLVDPRLPSTSWRLFADPAIQPVIEYAYLSSAQGPQLESRMGWEVLGAQFRVVLDFGCGIVDHRGTYLNPGA